VRGLSDCSCETDLSAPHDFNMEAVVANNFGQGDDQQLAEPNVGAVQLERALKGKKGRASDAPLNWVSKQMSLQSTSTSPTPELAP